ncbi:MAG TPA: hypothetical protein VNI57_11970, partial [Candidatus Saccharimonadales bacterium]|nr:hypothetical protein [Candidatus Saccharimonadales bacterium]
AEERAALAAAKRAEMESLRAELPPAAQQPAAAAEEDEVQAFLNREQRGDATSDEVSEFMDFIGDAGFDPESMPK